MKILILEDDADRRSAMEACLRDRFYQHEPVFFDDVAAMLAYMKSELESALAISLDHDLELLQEYDGSLTDPGTGRAIANYLAGQAPHCPIIIHSTNSAAGDGMEAILREAGWVTYRVHPFGDLEWIPTKWFRTVRDGIAASAKPRETAKPTA